MAAKNRITVRKKTKGGTIEEYLYSKDERVKKEEKPQIFFAVALVNFSISQKSQIRGFLERIASIKQNDFIFFFTSNTCYYKILDQL